MDLPEENNSKKGKKRAAEPDPPPQPEYIEVPMRPRFFALLSGRAFARGLNLGGCEVLVAHASLAASCRNPLLSGNGQVGEDASLGVFHDGAARDINDEVLGALAGAALGAAGLAVARLVQARVAHVEERGILLVHLEDHVTATAAVAAVGPAERNELFAVEAYDAVTALAGANFD